MKTLFTLRYLLFAVLFASTSACDKKKQEDPEPKTYLIQVHVVGSKMATAAIEITTTYTSAGVKGKPTEGHSHFETLSVSSDRSYDLGKFGSNDRVEVKLSGQGQSSDASLKAEILVDEVVRTSCQMQGSTATNASCAVETGDL